MADDALSSALEDIRPLAACQGDVAGLLRAVEAVLKMADRALVTMRDPDGKPWLWDLRPDEIRETITRALTGEAPGGGAIAWTPRCDGCNGFCGTCEAAVREEGGADG